MTFKMNVSVVKLNTKVQNCSHWFHGPTVSLHSHQWEIPVSPSGWVIVALGRRSVHRPFKVRKMEQIKLGSTCPLHMPRCNRVHFKCTGLSAGEQGMHWISVKWFLYLWCPPAARWEAWGQAAPLPQPAVLWLATDSDPENLEHLWPNLQKKQQLQNYLPSQSRSIFNQKACFNKTGYSEPGHRGCLNFLFLSYLSFAVQNKLFRGS